MNSKFLILLGFTSLIIAQNAGGDNFIRPSLSNTTTTTVPSTSTVPRSQHHHPIQTIKCVVKGEWFQKCVNAKETVKWNEQYKRSDHCFRFGICQAKGSKCEWKQTKEMSNCLEDMKKSGNKIIIE